MDLWSWIKQLFERARPTDRSVGQIPVRRETTPPHPPKKEKTLVNIGLDFGTSSSKVTFRDVVGQSTYLITLRPKLGGYEKFVLPSTVALVNGCLFFGKDLPELPTNTERFFRSIKICLACQTGKGECRGCEPALLGTEGSRGNFLIGNQEVSASQIATFYLAYLMKIARDIVVRHYGGRYEFRFTYNTAVPLDHLERGPTRQEFERAVFIAHQLSDSIHQGITLEKGLDLSRVTENLFPELPSISGRQSFVLAEPLAAIISYLNSPVAGDGFHAIVDIGAGTTDISFFKRFMVGQEGRIAFFHCDNHMVGGDDADEAIVQLARDTEPNLNLTDEMLLPLARSAKECYSSAMLKLQTSSDVLMFEDRSLDEFLEPVCRRVWEGYRQTWRTSYAKEQRESSWKQYTLFLLGGGTRFCKLRDVILEKPWERIREIRNTDLQTPADFLCLNDKDGDCFKSHSEMFAVAYGVSRHYAEWPEFFSPMEVECLEIHMGKPPRPSWDDFLNQD